MPVLRAFIGSVSWPKTSMCEGTFTETAVLMLFSFAINGHGENTKNAAIIVRSTGTSQRGATERAPHWSDHFTG